MVFQVQGDRKLVLSAVYSNWMGHARGLGWTYQVRNALDLLFYHSDALELTLELHLVVCNIIHAALERMACAWSLQLNLLMEIRQRSEGSQRHVHLC